MVKIRILYSIKMSDLCFREMALSAAEKQRQHRARRDADPERRAAYLRTHRKRWHESKEQGKVKTVKDLGEREKRRKRQSWKSAQRECRK